MNKRISTLLSLVVLSSVLSTPAFSAVKAGMTCKKVGSIATSAGKKFTCIKSGKKLVWSKGVAIAKPTSTQSVSPSPNPTVKPAELNAGISCNSNTQAVVKVTGSTLYCVRHSDGTTRFISVKDLAPSVSNPVSPEKMSACQPPDLRNGIPNGNFRWAITYPATPLYFVN
jgi:hypothetical protein